MIEAQRDSVRSQLSIGVGPLVFGVLGPVMAWGPHGAELYFPGREARLLAVLALRAGRPVWCSQLTDAVWGDSPPKTPSQALHNVVYRLRRMLTSAHIPTDITGQASGYTLEADSEAVDALRFEGLAKHAGRVKGLEAGERLRTGLALWRGDALEGLTGGSKLLTGEALRLDGLRLTTIERNIELELEAGHDRAVIPELNALTTEWPDRENLWAYLMIALYRSGQQCEALRSYRRLERYLIEESGMAPSRQLQRLELAILNHDLTEMPWTEPRVLA